MALEYVTVTGTFLTAVGNADSGSLMFTPSDIIWDPGNWVAALPASGVTLNPSGQFSLSLLAMDSAGLSGNWQWVVTMTLHGTVYPARKLTINFANGATQDLSTLLQTSTLA
jgi:hypothetical protein